MTATDTITKFLRVQRPDGDGPYQCAYIDKSKEVQKMHEHHNDLLQWYPSPVTDKGIRRFPQKEERCGFLDMEQLNAWFDEDELKILKADGFRVVEIEGILTAKGACQVLFIPTEA